MRNEPDGRSGLALASYSPSTRVCAEGLHGTSARSVCTVDLHAADPASPASARISARAHTVQSSAQYLCAECLCSRPLRHARGCVQRPRGRQGLSEPASATSSAPHSTTNDQRELVRCPAGPRGDDPRTLIQQRPAQTPSGPRARDSLAAPGPAERPLRCAPATKRHSRSSDGGAGVTVADNAEQRTTRPDNPRPPVLPTPQCRHHPAVSRSSPCLRDRRPRLERRHSLLITALFRAEVPQRNSSTNLHLNMLATHRRVQRHLLTSHDR